MSRYNYHQSAFKNGMISKKLLGRTDIDEYSYSAKDVFNFLPSSMGGVFSRPGTVLQRVFDSESCVIQWETSEDNFFLIYQPNSTVTSSLNFRLFDSSFREYVVSPSTAQLINWTTTTNLPTHASLISQQTNSNAEFENLDLNGFSYVSYENSLIVCHNSGLIPPIVFYTPQFLVCTIEHYLFSSRVSVSTTTGAEFQNVQINTRFQSTPYDINRDSSIFLLPSSSGTAGTQTTSHVTGTLTAYNALSGGSTTAYFTNEMVHTFFVLNQGNVEGVYFITSLVDSTQANVIVIYYGLDNTTRSRNFRRQLFSKDLGFPKIVSSYNNRLIFANTLAKPSWFFASKTNYYGEILAFRLFQQLTAAPITEIDSFELPLTSRDFSEIKWISQQNDLLMGTGREEFVLNQGENALSIVNIGISPQSSIGSNFVQPVKTSEAIFMVSSDGKTIRKLQYNFDVRGYRSQNISILNDDLIYKLRPNQSVDSLAEIIIKKLAWAESSRILWVLTSSNNLFSVSIEPSTTTTAWAYHFIGDNPEIINIFTFFSYSLSRDVLGIVCKRGTKYTLEFLAPEYLNDSLEVESLNIGDQPVFTDMAHLIALESSPVPIADGFYNSTLGYQFRTDPSGFAQRYPTGKRFIISDYSKVFGGDPDEPALFNGQIVYLINEYQGYGNPTLKLATSRSNALAGTVLTTPYVYNITLTDNEPTATYTEWGSFPHLAGETVDVMADGVLIEDLVVSAGGIVTLPVAASKIVIGYRFESQLEPVTPDIGGQFGSSQGSMKRIDRAYVRYYKTRTGKIGSRVGNLEPIVFPETPFTGAIEHYIDSSTDREYSIILKKEQSLPMNIMSITLRGKSDE